MCGHVLLFLHFTMGDMTTAMYAQVLTLQCSFISHASRTRGTEGSRGGTHRSKCARFGDHPYLRKHGHLWSHRALAMFVSTSFGHASLHWKKGLLNRWRLPESSAVFIAADSRQQVSRLSTVGFNLNEGDAKARKSRKRVGKFSVQRKEKRKLGLTGRHP